VQRVLGHKTLNTTLQYYTGMETKAAMAQYDAQVLHLRGDPCPPPAKAPRRKSRA
jgi:integrase